MTVNTLHRPTHRDALVHLEAAFERGDMMTIFGRCTVDYDGRATSELGPGDRLVVLKPDGSILVHTDEKRTPVNWQPPGCTHSASVRDGRLRVRSTRTSPDERLDVQFERVEQCSAYAVNDRSDLELVEVARRTYVSTSSRTPMSSNRGSSRSKPSDRATRALSTSSARTQRAFRSSWS